MIFTFRLPGNTTRCILTGASVFALGLFTVGVTTMPMSGASVHAAEHGSGGQSGGGKHLGRGGSGGGSAGSGGARGGHVSGEDAILHDSPDATDHVEGGHDAADAVLLAAGSGSGSGKGAGGQRGGSGQGGAGSGRSMEDKIIGVGEDEEDSDRPEWAGPDATGDKPGSTNPTPGVDKGDLYGDLYVLLRDADGVPIVNADGYVQPIDADGNLIPLDEEGAVPEEYAALLQEVDFGRLNVGRSPDKVLDSRLEEAIANLNDSDSGTLVSIDASGRLTYVVDGEVKTIDAPLENLALYLDLMADGKIDGLASSLLDPALVSLTTDGLTLADLTTAASLLAAAADKTSSIDVDVVVYMNSILGVTGTDPIVTNDAAYFDYSDYTYDRESVWGDVTSAVLVYDSATDTWVLDPNVSIYDAVFENTDASATNIAAFALAADDALQVIEFVHEYQLPATPETSNLDN